MTSASALSQIVQSEAELPLQLNYTTHRNFCGLVLSLSLLPCSCSPCHVLILCVSCQYPVPPSHELSYPTELKSLAEIYLFNWPSLHKSSLSYNWPDFSKLDTILWKNNFDKNSYKKKKLSGKILHAYISVEYSSDGILAFMQHLVEMTCDPR